RLTSSPIHSTSTHRGRWPSSICWSATWKITCACRLRALMPRKTLEDLDMGVSVGDSASTLGRAMDDLLKRWEATAGPWQDKARDDFEKEYITELAVSVK